MQLIRQLRLPAIACSLAVLLCELVARPYANMGICDDGPYILVAQKLATTGHIIYNGWSAAGLVWQLYLGALMIKIFGFSFTTVRMSTWVVAIVLAFVLQRTFVLAGASERNSTIGTLALVLSPLYLELSVTFMSDIHGLFGVLLCLYGCLRSLQTSKARATVGWLSFAVSASVLCGTSRQIAWLGALVMVPCAVWLLKAQRRTFLAGVGISCAGYLAVFFCMRWLKLQPYTIPERFNIGRFPVLSTVHQFVSFFLDIPFLILPVMALFLPQTRRIGLRLVAVIVLICGVALALVPSRLGPPLNLILEPTFRDWVTVFGEFSGAALNGNPPVFLSSGVRILFTIFSMGGLLGLIGVLFKRPLPTQDWKPVDAISWKSLKVLLVPFTLAYILLLMYRAITIGDGGTPELLDRYSLELLVVLLIVLVRFYQDRIQPKLPLVAFVFIAIMGAYGVVVTHNTFALYRARVALAQELRSAGVPDTSVDSGWEYNLVVEILESGHINERGIQLPAHLYVPVPPPAAGTCLTPWYDKTPHVKARYGVSFYSDTCYGLAPFAPMTYSRWLASKPGTLYVVRYTPATH